ncbi:GNAT family N-acetyltransferase [Vibrio sp. 10N.261.46.A3]|uniref:GNAT family N-acetyltransferase n=1 Tax=Vibrio sp. 10N.261.46.A3 TaxID=3229658 RepID=UPI0035525B37
MKLVELNEEHLEFLRNLRNSDYVSKNLISNNVITKEMQQIWFDKLINDKSRVYFVVMMENNPIGCLSFSHSSEGCGEWGLFLSEDNSWPGTAVLLEIIALDFAFEFFNISSLTAEVLPHNKVAIRLHNMFKYKCLEERNVVDGKELLVFEYTKLDWEKNRRDIIRKIPRSFIGVLDNVTLSNIFGDLIFNY